ncbi:TPA: hypothetical protein IUU01_000600 [Enterococcus faecalis]|uniref:phage protein n=1 Tax=Enterococcus faecalis TaxID=1351 RepID=UPI0008A5C1FA|nr:hypothetical protein [Enterococcus faecalis]OGX76833.1 hypothetical protein BHU49_02240 [Enterococcus faecalis]OSM18047.1 hypothetical protein B6S40_09205 [Enterococcus faecalis]HAP3854162.1 hypothetical protein [Enterococcus faecalis]
MGNTQWQRLLQIEIHDKNGKNRVLLRADSGRLDRLEIHFTAPFSDSPNPSEVSVTIYNLNKKSIDFIKKGNPVYIHAGYAGTSNGVITSGTIAEVKPSVLNGVDRATTFTFLEGKDYSEQKEVNITFNNGTDAHTIINRVAREANIPLSEIKLKNNKIYGSGYTADGQAMMVLEEISKACDTSLYFKRGQLVIKNFRDGNKERYRLSPETGLINQPTKVESHDYTGWSVECLLQHKITTGTAVYIDSKNVKGNFYVKNGQHSYDGSRFVTTCEVVS